ncbi:MAG TPA: hypothetical protein VJ934_07365 [Desulfomicrobiaceae bacterium]|nr:hypothetical protein [Desulfomicrobiaceae bacterium]
MTKKYRYDNIFAKIITITSLVLICLGFVFSSSLQQMYYEEGDKSTQCFAFISKNAYYTECAAQNGSRTQVR